MLKFKPTVESWDKDEYIGDFEKDDDVTIYIDDEMIFGEIREIKEGSIVIDVEWEGDIQEISFMEIDYIEEA